MRLSVDQAVDRPKEPVDRSVHCVQPRVLHVNRSTERSTVILLRSTGRSTELPCACFVHTNRPSGRSALLCAHRLTRRLAGPAASSVLVPFSLLLAFDLCAIFLDEFEKKKFHHIFLSSLSLQHAWSLSFNLNLLKVKRGEMRVDDIIGAHERVMGPLEHKNTKENLHGPSMEKRIEDREADKN